MIKDFNLILPHRTIFGNGKINELPALAKLYGNDILLVTGQSSFINSKYCENLCNTFDLIGIKYHMFTVSHEPSPENIDQAVIRFSNIPVKLVIAIGGGSVIDSGKALSAMLFKKESVTDYLEGVGNLVHPGNKIPFIAVPTTSGTGSEATKNAVISHTGKNGYKRSLRHDNFIPDIALLDPELTLSCSKEQTAISGMDCFSQLIESYLSDKSFPFTDNLAIEGITAIKNYLIRSWNWGQDLEAREGMSYAAYLSGICLTNAGLGAVHGFASSVGGIINIPHGTICGTLMGITNRITVRNLRANNPCHTALMKYAALGKIFCVEINKSKDYYIDFLLNAIDELVQKFAIKGLSYYGVTNIDLSSIVSETNCKSHPAILSTEELTEILASRL